jgi:hypothetical protein
VVSGHVSGAVCTGLSVGAIQPGGLVSTELGEGSIRSPITHSKSRSRPASVRRLADLDVAASRRLARELEAGATSASV